MANTNTSTDLSESYRLKEHLVPKNIIKPGENLEIQLSSGTTEWQVDLYTLNRKKIQSVPKQYGTMNTDVDGKPRVIILFNTPSSTTPGVYFLYIRTNESSYRVKILVQNP